MKKVLLVLFAFSLSTSVFAQTNISISNVTLADTVSLNQTLLYSISFTNNATTDFTGSIAAKATVQGTPINDLITGSSFTIAAGDTTQFTGLQMLFSVSNSFNLGDNVVVIWPVAMSATDTLVGDTVHQNVHVLFPNGIDDFRSNLNLSIGVILKNQWMIFNQTQTTIAETNIYDLNGRRIENIVGDINQVQLENISSGIYFFKVIQDGAIIGVGKISFQ